MAGDVLGVSGGRAAGVAFDGLGGVAKGIGGDRDRGELGELVQGSPTDGTGSTRYAELVGGDLSLTVDQTGGADRPCSPICSLRGDSSSTTVRSRISGPSSVRLARTGMLRHVLTHTAGLPAMPREITSSDLPEWSRSLRVAGRRATGQIIGDLLHEWIAVPLNTEGQPSFAVPNGSLPALALLEQQVQQWPAVLDDGDAILARWESRPSADFGNTSEILRTDIPSVCTETLSEPETPSSTKLNPTKHPPSEAASSQPKPTTAETRYDD